MDTVIRFAYACSNENGHVPPVAAVPVQTGFPLNVVVEVGAFAASKE